MHSAGTDVGTDLAPPIPPKDLPLYQFLLAGGFGGISSRTTTAPLERVKIQAQMGNRAALMSQLSRILSKEEVFQVYGPVTSLIAFVFFRLQVYLVCFIHGLSSTCLAIMY